MNVSSVDKYSPRDLKDMLGMDKTIKSLDKWYSTLKKKYIVCLNGSHGSGKTTLAKLYLESKDYEIIYFDITECKSRSVILDKLKESFMSYDICNLFMNKKKPMGYIIDNIDNNLFGKNDIKEICALFDKNSAYKPIILIGTYVKNPGYPKKKVETIKICNPSDYIMCKIGEKFMNSMGKKIDQINLKLFVSKSQQDIRKLLLHLEYFSRTGTLNHDDLVKKDCDYNLFKVYGNMMNNYIDIKDDKELGDILLNYTAHQNAYEFTMNNYKGNKAEFLGETMKSMINSLEYELYMNKTQNYDYINLMYLMGPKTMSYKYNKKKNNKNSDIEIDYPKYCFVTNNKSSYKKLMLLFREYEFYNYIKEDNFKIFLQTLFKNKEKYSYILDKLKLEDIKNLIKVTEN